MMSAGHFLWNSRIFLFRAQDMIEAFKAHAPIILTSLEKQFNASSDLGCAAVEPWSSLENISIDYAIMEKANNLVAVPYTSSWSDLGGWDAVWSESESDLSGNVTSQSAYAIDCSNTLLRSESANQSIVGIALDSIIAIAMPDAVLVASKDSAQDVKAVELLKKNNHDASWGFPKRSPSVGLVRKFGIRRSFPS